MSKDHSWREGLLNPLDFNLDASELNIVGRAGSGMDISSLPQVLRDN